MCAKAGGNKKVGGYWKRGPYQWEAYIDGRLVGTQKFWIEDVGEVAADENPYFNVAGLKLFEGPNSSIPKGDRVYFKSFNGSKTRYVFAECIFENLAREHTWNCELIFKFYNDAHQLKGETLELVTVNPSQETFTITSGWGSNDFGTWYPDNYSLEVIFMDNLVRHASLYGARQL